MLSVLVINSRNGKTLLIHAVAQVQKAAVFIFIRKGGEQEEAEDTTD